MLVFVMCGVWWVQYSPTDPLHNLVQPPALCGDNKVAPKRPGIHSSLGSKVADTRASSSRAGVPSSLAIGEAACRRPTRQGD